MLVRRLFKCSKLCYNLRITEEIIATPNDLMANFDLKWEENLAIGTPSFDSENCLFLKTTESKWSCLNARKGLAFQFEKDVYFVEIINFVERFAAKLNFIAYFQLRKDFFECQKVLAAHFAYAQSWNHFCDNFVSIYCSLLDSAKSNYLIYASGQQLSFLNLRFFLLISSFQQFWKFCNYWISFP